MLTILHTKFRKDSTSHNQALLSTRFGIPFFTMPKLLTILRGRKSSSEAQVKTRGSKKNVIFRGATYQRSKFAGKSDNEQPPTILVPSMTFSLSEDEGDDIIHTALSDIENQVVESSESSMFEVTPAKLVTTSGPETRDMSVGTEDNETMTFSHLQIMRNELSHMMQLAEKDREIEALYQSNQFLTSSHEEEMASKNAEIVKIMEALAVVEAALARADVELVSVNKEYSRTIEILMQTQYELYQLKHSSPSWMAPVLSFFDFS
jgi:hypothetical protein